MPEESLEALKQHSRVLDLYRSKLRLIPRGREWDALCPFHSEKHPSFQLNNRSGKWLYHCKSCGEGGDILTFIQKTESTDFKNAVRIAREFTSEWSQNRVKTEAVFKPFGQEENKVHKTYTLEEYGRMQTALCNNPIALGFLERERGITADTAKRLRLGYRQDVGRLAGDENADVAARGWVVLPTFDRQAVTSLKYRSISRKNFCKSPGMATQIFNLETIDFLEPVFVVEGEFDAAVFEQSGFRAVSLPNATYKCTPADKDLLLQAECVILAGDNDPAGNEAIQRLWKELQERTYLLKWPEGVKDANQFFLETCGRDPIRFRTEIERLVVDAKSRPMDGIRSLPEMMVNQGGQNVVDDPNRFRFPWQNVDDMAILSPGSVIGVVATNTGQGKTSWVTQATIEAARKHGEIVLNYQAELTDEQFARMATAQILRKHRLQLTKADFQEAARLLAGVKYYVGRNPVLNTIGPVLDLIEAGIRRLGPTCVVLDNLHYLARNDADQVKSVENAMQRIKSLAAFHKLKFFVVGQPKKAEATSKGKALHISDVRGSASFGDDSDVVYALHREMIKSTDEDRRNDYKPETRVRLVKVRDKGTGDAEVDLVFLGELALFATPAYNKPDDTLPFGPPENKT
jgi:hypothetical protein